MEKPAMAASPAPFPVATKSITVEHHPVSKLVKTKLTIIGHSQDVGEEITLAPRLHFTSFQALKAQTEALLRSLPSAKESSLVSLQYRDAEGDLIDLLPSTFDPDDFRGASRVVLRVKVHLVTQPSPSPPPELLAPPAKKTMPLAKTKKTAPRRVLGRRDPNTLYAAPPMSAAAGTAAGRHVAKKKSSSVKITPRSSPAAAAAAAATGMRSSSATTTIPTARGDDKAAAGHHHHKPQVPLAKIAGRGGGGRSPEFVFGAGESRGAPDSRDDTGAKLPRGKGRGKAATAAVAEPGSRRRQRATAGAAASSSRKPSWNNGNEPAWEEREKKKVIMQRAARARILGKRAAFATKQTGGRGGGAGGGAWSNGKGPRVIRRAKRDCRVTDSRRKRLGAFLFQDPIGAPPPSLGKRKLGAYREFGKTAAAIMKYVPVTDSDSMPKRGRGCGEGPVVFPRGNAVEVVAAPCTVSRAHDIAVPKNIDKRIVIAPASNRGSGKRLSANAGSPSALPAALRPLTARPGDIGFGSAAGFRMRPPAPVAPFATRRGVGFSSGTTASRGGGGGSGGTGSSCGKSSSRSRGKGAAALTAAAAAKVTCPAEPPSWPGRLRSEKSADALGVRGAGGTVGGEGAAGGRAGGRKEDDVAAASIMAKLARGGGGGGGGGAGGENVETLQEQVALLKVAAGLSDEELTWRMETAKPEANAYRIASAALEKAESTYERLLWRQGQLQVAHARLTGRGVGGDAATSAFAAAIARVVKGGNLDDRALSRLRSSSDAVVVALEEPARGVGGGAGVVFPAAVAAFEVRAAGQRMARLAAAVEATASTGTELDRAAVVEEVSAEAAALAARAEGVGRELCALGRRVEGAVGQMESWQQRRTEAPEFAAEEAAREMAWSDDNREANVAALREMRALLPEAVWDMNAGDIQAAAAVGTEVVERAPKADMVEGGEKSAEEGALEVEAATATAENGKGVGHKGGGVFYPSDLCVRLRECRPLHWLVSSPEDIAGANFLSGEGAAAFTQLEGMDLVEMRAVWCVLPKEFSRDADGKKAEWRARFRVQLEGLARQQDRATVTAGWDPVRGRRATCRMPPLPPHRERHPAYSYPTVEATEVRLMRLREQRRRLEDRKMRLSALDQEVLAAKAEVDSACADARSGELRKLYGADTLRTAREAAKNAYVALTRERKALAASAAETERMLSSTYPSLPQLESEAELIAEVYSRNNSVNNGTLREAQRDIVNPKGSANSSATASGNSGGAAAGRPVCLVRVPGAFSTEPELRRRAVAAAKKLTPEEERRLRASEVQNAVSKRGEQSSASGFREMPDAAAVDAAGADDETAAPMAQRGDAGEISLSAPSSGYDLLQREGEAGRGGAAEMSLTESGAGVEARKGAGVELAPGDNGDVGRNGSGEAAGESACEAGEPRRRRVKVAPGVLAFLTKEYSDRAATGMSSVVAKGAAGLSPSVTAPTPPGCSPLGGPGGSGGVPPPPPPLPCPPAAKKPISKSLAALLAMKCNESGEGLASGGGGVTGGGGGNRAASASPLGFLDELKARAKAKDGRGSGTCVDGGNESRTGRGGGGGAGVGQQVLAGGDGGTVRGGVSTSGGSEQVSARARFGGGLARVPVQGATAKAGGGVSFLDELRARTARIS